MIIFFISVFLLPLFSRSFFKLDIPLYLCLEFPVLFPLSHQTYLFCILCPEIPGPEISAGTLLWVDAPTGSHPRG